MDTNHKGTPIVTMFVLQNGELQCYHLSFIKLSSWGSLIRLLCAFPLTVISPMHKKAKKAKEHMAVSICNLYADPVVR